MKAQTVRLKSIKIIFRDYKHFDKQIFLEDLQSIELIRNSDCPNENYNDLTCCFLSIVSKRAPLKIKIIRGRNAPFINKKITLFKELNYSSQETNFFFLKGKNL